MTGWYRSPPCALILAILLGTIAAVLGVGGFAASAASPVMQGAPPAATATPIPEPGGYAPSLPIGGSVRLSGHLRPGGPAECPTAGQGMETHGFQAVIAWGELDPEEEGKDVLVAYSQDGQLLGSGYGMAMLVVPGDSTNSRYVASITKIVVVPAR